MPTHRHLGRMLVAAVGVAAAMLLSAAPSSHSQESSITVFAAASLKTAFDRVNAACEAQIGQKATISYAGSSALARQIEQGAPADVFISADLDWMDYLSEKKLTKPGTETKLLGNRLVLVAPADSAAAIAIAPDFDLAGLIGDGRLAMANTDAVPAGRYGKAALETFGVWASVDHKIAQAENVRAALALVAIGEAPLGIVYETDAVAEPRVKIVGRFPEESHPPIVYPVAELASSTDDDVPAFLNCVRSAKAKELFEAQGFTVLTPVASNRS